jgi:hypothetical protein
MEPIRVLIMCQRKKSYKYTIEKGHKFEDALSVDMTVKKIEEYVYDYYKTRNITIEYLTHQPLQEEYDADYKMLFEPTSKHTEIRLKSYEFLREHCGYYDMIMLQTCPLMHFTQNFKYLPWLMKPDGVLTIKAFTAYDTKCIVDTRVSAPHVHPDIMKYFDNIDVDTFKIITKED